MRLSARFRIYATSLCMVVILIAAASIPGHAASYRITLLTADQSGIAPNTDPNLVNPWGISFSAIGPFWMADNNSGVSTIYQGTGVPNSLVVTIPPPPGFPKSKPTGTVFNGTTDFVITKGTASGPATFRSALREERSTDGIARSMLPTPSSSSITLHPAITKAWSWLIMGLETSCTWRTSSPAGWMCLTATLT